MYRQTLGPAFPGEPTDPAKVKALKKDIMRGGIPEIDQLRVPIGKAANRVRGRTSPLWRGPAVWTAMNAAATLAESGIDAEVIDLRTLVPPDLDTVYESVQRTGHLVVAAEDRSFAGFVRTIQGHVVDRFPGIPTRALGQKNVPGIAQCLKLEEATILTADDIVRAAGEVRAAESTATGAGGWRWVPPRYFVN